MTDKGIVLKNSDGLYFCGLRTYDKQLRKAKIYHSAKYADAAIEDIKNDPKSWIKKDFVKVNVKIKEI